MRYDTAKLRRFLQSRFSDGELKDLLLDYFHPVYDDITEEMSKRRQVRLLLDYCRQHGRMDDLLAALQRERPYQFAPDDFVLEWDALDLAPAAIPSPAPRNPFRILISFLRGGYERGLEWFLAVLKGENETQDRVLGKSVIVPPASSPESTASDGRNSWIHPKTGIEMVQIPAGEFLYGDGEETVYLDEFWIAKTPVTNADYARFVVEMGWAAPMHWKGTQLPEAIADHPVVYISWCDAQAYAEWAGGEVALPTEQQWEKAARGTDGRKYPWGDKWRDDRCNTSKVHIGGTSPIGQFSPQGDSPYGCVDMSGNVWEWTVSGGERLIPACPARRVVLQRP